MIPTAASMSNPTFFHEKERSVVYIGSSNLSKSALTSGIEWNYCFDTNTDPINYKAFYETLFGFI